MIVDDSAYWSRTEALTSTIIDYHAPFDQGLKSNFNGVFLVYSLQLAQKAEMRLAVWQIGLMVQEWRSSKRLPVD